MKRHRKLTALIAVLAMGSVYTLSVGGASAGTAAKSSGPVVKLMVIAQVTDRSGSGVTTPEAGDAAKAAAKAIKAAGGTNFSIEVCDEQGTADAAAACARKAVSDGVVATVGDVSQNGAVILPVLEAANISSVGHLAGTPADFSSKVAFPLWGSPALIAGMVKRLIDLGKTKIALGVVDNALAAQVPVIAKLGTNGTDATIVHSTTIPSGQPDLSSVAAETADGADGIVLATLPPTEARFIETARQQGIKLPMAVSAGTGVSPEVLKSFGEQSGLNFVASFMPFTAKFAGMKQYLSEMKKYAPKALLDDYTTSAWLSVHLLDNMLQKNKPATIDAASVLDGLSNLTDQDMYGIMPPYTTTTPVTLVAPFGTALSHAYNHTVTYQKLKKGKFYLAKKGFVDPLEGSLAP